MANRFLELFGDGETVLHRAPGRVNLIGEHTDYNGLPVLPMAIPHDVRILSRPREDRTVRIANTSNRYGLREFTLEAALPPFDQGDWGNYAKASIQGVISHAGWDSRNWRGFDAVVDGNIPEAAGLSSSSALVVGFGLVFCHLNGVEIERRELADLMAGAEHYVGTRGGGMDQAVCLLAEAGSALLIDFFPLRTVPVPVPDDAAFVVCDSLVTAPKSREARVSYNRRALESRLAAAILSGGDGGASVEPEHAPRLGDLTARDSAPSLLQRLEATFGTRPWTPQDTATALGISVETLDRTWFHSYGVPLEASVPLEIESRARHVLTEGDRVLRAAEALRSHDMGALGTLMDESHRSCARDFGISTPELDRLVEIARSHGALGSRLTGAGFGGCTVSLVPKKRLAEFRAGIAREYYATALEGGHDGSPGPPFCPIYVCFPAAGALKIG
jgi:N-acetylgalactosamine kinase